MPANASESYLATLAARTFLAPWAHSNTFYRPGKELTDLIVPFGDDILIMSDKASDFDLDIDVATAWRRWSAKTIDDTLRQLRTARQRIDRSDDEIFLDAKAHAALPFGLAPADRRRFHLIGIARPARDPGVVPPSWPGLTYVGDSPDRPFDIGPLQLGGIPVHLFDGPTIDLLLGELDTAHDFIAYLRGRATATRVASRYRFREPDLLAASIENWAQGSGLAPAVPALSQVRDGAWRSYAGSDRRLRSQNLNKPSRRFDALISIHHHEVAEGRSIGPAPEYAAHEHALRLLAAESRFARRMITAQMDDAVQSPGATFNAATLKSPTTPGLRYVWLAYPQPPADMSTSLIEQATQDYLTKHILVARGLFDEPLVLGIAIPKKGVTDTATYFRLLDGSSWTEDDFVQARLLGEEQDIFSALEQVDSWHAP